MSDLVMQYVLMDGWDDDQDPVAVFADEADAQAAAQESGGWIAAAPAIPAGGRLPARVPVYFCVIRWNEQVRRYEVMEPQAMGRWPWEPMPVDADRACFGADPQAAYAAGRERAAALQCRGA